MAFIAAQIPVILLVIGKGKQQLLISAAVCALILCTVLFLRKKNRIVLDLRLHHPLAASLVCSVLALLFYVRWGNTARFQSAAGSLGVPVRQSCLVCAFLLAGLSLIGVDQLITVFLTSVRVKLIPDRLKNERCRLLIFLLLASVLITFLNSRCSLLYPFQDGCDQNTMFTVGKGVLKGYVMYRDLYEQKGPLLLFIHTFGAALSFDSFWGVWILEIAACFFFMLISLRILELFRCGKALWMLPLLAAAVYGSPAFGMGDTAEEFALPFMIYALYVGCRALKNDRLPSSGEFFLIGVTSGFIFWMKYSMIGFYFGWILVLFIQAVLSGNIPGLFRQGCRIILGVLAVSLPVFIYFLVNGSLDSLFRSYFYNNMVYYPAYRNWARSLIYSLALKSCFKYALIPMIMAVLGCLYMVMKKEWKVLLLLTAGFLFLFYFVYSSGYRHFYYCLIFCVYSVFGICFLDHILARISRRGGQEQGPAGLPAFALSAALVLLCLGSDNMYALDIPKEQLFPFRMKEVVDQSGIENASVLHYRILDMGINTSARLIPNMKYFCYYNNDHLEETLEQQKQCLAEQCVDYVIMQSTSPYSWQELETYEHQGVFPADQGKETVFLHYYVSKSPAGQ